MMNQINLTRIQEEIHTSNSMASSDKSVLRSHGCNDHSSNINVSPPVQHSPNVTNANVDLHDTAGGRKKA